MKSLNEQLKEFQDKPLEVGDLVKKYKYENNLKDIEYKLYKVIEINDDLITLEFENNIIKCNKNLIAFKYDGDIGYNPFVIKDWWSHIKILSFSLESILMKMGYEKQFKYNDKFDNVGFMNFNPHIIKSNGEKFYFQRPFCWSLNDKQLLIESIYNNIDIGKIIVRKRAFKYVENQLDKNENVYWYDVIDGKQRLNALYDFVNNNFPDKNGFYFKDFSKKSKSKFLNFDSLSYGEVGENATDDDIIKIFLNVNFSGKKMSQKHIDYVIKNC